MAGRKHHLQQFGRPSADLNQIEDPFERDLLFRSTQVTPFCKHCGGEIIQDGTDSKYQGEIAAMGHTDCHLAWEETERQRKLAEQRRIEKERANFNMDEYIERMMNQREGH